MKRIVCSIITIILVISAFGSTAGAVSYTDVQPMFAPIGDVAYYTNSSSVTDDMLQNRAGTYGYVMRLHYQPVEYPTLYSEEYDYYDQIPGEFYEKSITYANHRENVKTVSALSLYSYVLNDCSALGYTVTAGVVDPTTDYVPPSASIYSDKRLIMLVCQRKTNSTTGKKELSYRFYMQNDDNYWSFKEECNPARYKCDRYECEIDRTTDTPLTNSNIMQHIRCNEDFSQSVLIPVSVYTFYVNIPGATDMCHDNGHDSFIYYTPMMTRDTAGNYSRSAHILADINQATSTTGRIDHKDDSDYYVFNVTSSGTYVFNIYKATTYPLKVELKDATNIQYPSYAEPKVISADASRYQFTADLTAGERYLIRVYRSDQTSHILDQYYTVTIAKTS